MSEVKTKATKESVLAFLKTINADQKREDSLNLLNLFKKITKEKPVLWGQSGKGLASPGIVGFGKYHYKSKSSSREGEWMLTGFSARSLGLSVYLMMFYLDPKDTENKELLKKLGKHKMGGGCLYINKLTDVDLKVLTKLIKKNFQFMKKKYV